MKLLPALLASCLFATIANAAPWKTEETKYTSMTVYSAVQYDGTEDYVLSVECSKEKGFEVLVETPFDWPEEVSFEAVVPTTITIDGRPQSDVMFHFDDRQFGEGITASPEYQPVPFGKLMIAMGEARESIKLDYNDRSATFSAENLGNAMYELSSHCL